jgi:hypothetical protein
LPQSSVSVGDFHIRGHWPRVAGDTLPLIPVPLENGHRKMAASTFFMQHSRLGLWQLPQLSVLVGDYVPCHYHVGAVERLACDSPRLIDEESPEAIFFLNRCLALWQLPQLIS